MYIDLFWKFFKFGVVGFTGLIIDYGITYLLKEKVKIYKYLANAAGFSVAATTNYCLNRVWTFHSKDPNLAIEYGQFILVSVVGLGINSLILWLMVSKFKFNFYFSKLIAIGITTIWNFTANVIITFA
jgi:putative flippase GtrA